jgi:hypothetical protein
MPSKTPEVYVAIYDVDGTLANDSPKKELAPEEYYTPNVLSQLKPNWNVVTLMRKHIRHPEFRVTVISGRETRLKSVTEQWINRFVPIVTEAAHPVRVYTRPDGLHHSKISAFKMEIAIRVVRRVSLRSVSIECYDDDIETLKMYNGALQRMCRMLKLFRVDGGIISRWEL